MVEQRQQTAGGRRPILLGQIPPTRGSGSALEVLDAREQQYQVARGPVYLEPVVVGGDLLARDPRPDDELASQLVGLVDLVRGRPVAQPRRRVLPELVEECLAV